MRDEFDKLEVNTKISVTELRRLLIGINEHQRNTGFRYRLLGELWYPAFVSVVTVTDSTAMFFNENNNRLVSIDLSSVMQFEIDLRFQEFQPNFHYTIFHLR